MIDPRVQSLCEEFSVRIVPKSSYPAPGETRAVGALAKIINRHGIEHARLVMTTLAEKSAREALGDRSIVDGTVFRFEECAKSVARAIMAERERCADIADFLAKTAKDWAQSHGDPEASAMHRIQGAAAEFIAADIRRGN